MGRGRVKTARIIARFSRGDVKTSGVEIVGVVGSGGVCGGVVIVGARVVVVIIAIGDHISIVGWGSIMNNTRDVERVPFLTFI